MKCAKISSKTILKTFKNILKFLKQGLTANTGSSSISSTTSSSHPKLSARAFCEISSSAYENIDLKGSASVEFTSLLVVMLISALKGSSYTGSSYTGSSYTGSSYTGSSYTGSSYTGSSYTGSSYTGSSYTGSSYTGS